MEWWGGSSSVRFENQQKEISFLWPLWLFVSDILIL